MTDHPAAPHRKKVGADKFTTQACAKCGTPQATINGQWLRERRIAAGFSLREMAKRIGCSTAYLCDIELGRRNCVLWVRSVYEELKIRFEVGSP